MQLGSVMRSGKVALGVLYAITTSVSESPTLQSASYDPESITSKPCSHT